MTIILILWTSGPRGKEKKNNVQHKAGHIAEAQYKWLFLLLEWGLTQQGFMCINLTRITELTKIYRDKRWANGVKRPKRNYDK